MTAVAHIFAPITAADPKARTITVEVGRSKSAFDAVDGGRETVLTALKALKGGPVVEMTTASPQVGEVLSVEDVGRRIRLTAVITDPQTWRKLEHMVFKGCRVALYGDDTGKPHAGALMLADVPDVGDMVVRRAGAANRGYEACLTIDEARAALRELRRVIGEAEPVVAAAEAFHRRPLAQRERVRVH